MDFKTHYDAVIVGGGHNGLVAAAYLAGAGQSVLVLERNARLGGATSSQAIFPGMDARISRYSYLVSLFPQAVVDDLGLRFSCRRRRIASCTPYEQDGRHGALLLSNVSDEVTHESFKCLTDDADWRGYHALLEMERIFAERVWPSMLQQVQSRRQWLSSLKASGEREAWEAFVELPLGQTIERYLKNDVLRGVVFTDAKVGVFTHPHDLSLLQNRCYILHVIGQGTGEWHVPIGGMGALVDALTDAAQRAGAICVGRAPVSAVHTGNPRHTIVFQHGDREHSVEATRVLVNAGPQVLAGLLRVPYSPAPDDEGSVCKVNMLVRRLPRPRAGEITPCDAFTGTFHIDESYAQMQVSYGQAAAGEIPGPCPSEMYCHTLTDDSILGTELRDAGYHSLTLFGLDAPYRLFEQDHEKAKTEMLRRYLAGLNRVLAEPIEDCLALDAEGRPCIEIKTPVELSRDLSLNWGNIFHDAPSWFFCNEDDEVGSWGVETAYERIYRCGSSALRGGGVSGIPGHNAARCIFQELGLESGPIA